MVKAGELAAAQRWLEHHSGSSHTRRKYDAQLQQLCEWLLPRGRTLTDADTADLQTYLEALVRGELSPTEGAKVPRSRATVVQSRSILSSLFDALVRERLRHSNPISTTTVPAPNEMTELLRPSRNQWQMRWLSIRAGVILRAREDESPRSPLRRAVAIAELASWSGLRRSELAAATMDSFVQMHKRWWIRVPRFGHGNTDFIEVPQPAMDAVSQYRLCRQLPKVPSPDEQGIPLIVRIRSERPIAAWSIANALKDLLTTPEAGRPTIVALRREVASEGLRAKIAAHQLARHMRSTTLVDQVAQELAQEAIGLALERLAA